MSKVVRPILADVFPRKRLFNLLDQMRKHPAIWVSGPAGCGKTTLVNSYLEARKISCLWYEVDEGDADQATFFYYMGQAAKKAAPRKRKSLPLLTPEYLQDIPTFTNRFFEKLYERLPIPSVIVFDNYQEVSAESSIHGAILKGLSNLPTGINAILISRSGPPSALVRLRANHLMEILPWKDLRLTVEESAGIIKLRSKQKFSKETITTLHKAADGWIAGLVLILERAKLEDIEFQKAGTAKPEEIFDYFAHEIFDRVDKEVQEFLLKTSILPMMTTKMAEEISGLSSASRLLSTLSRNNYFTEKSIRSEPVYRYHSLFREFLLSRVKETFLQENLTPLFRHAVSLLEDDGQIEAAVMLLHEIGDTEGITSFIMNHASSLVAQGRYQTLGAWIIPLPKEVIENHPWLLYWKGVSQFSVDPSQAHSYFEKAFEKFRIQNDLSGILLAWSGVVESIFHGFKDISFLDRWISLLPKLDEKTKEFVSLEAWGRVVSSMFFALTNRYPDHPEINVWTERAISIGEGPGLPVDKALILFHLERWYVMLGDFGQASLVNQSLQHLSQSRESLPLVVLLAIMSECFLYQLEGNHEKCLKAISDGLKISEDTGIFSFYCHLIGHAIMSCLNTGDLETAQNMLQKMVSSLNRLKLIESGYYHFCQGRLLLLRSELVAASLQTELGLQAEIKSGYYIGLSLGYLISAQVLHRMGKQEEAWSHLKEVFHFAERFNSKLLEYYGFMIKAYFHFDQGDEGSGLASLRKALAVGNENGIPIGFFDQPAVTARLCVKALEENIEVPYVEDIIRKRRLIPEEPPIHLENWPWLLKVFTLGRFDLLKDGKPIQSSRKIQQRPLSLLKALIALGGREVKEELIADFLWPEADGDAAHHAFVSALHRLRQLAGYEKALHFREGKLSMDNRYFWVDAWALEHILDQADVSRKEGRIDVAIQCSEKVIEMYRGHFLSGETEQIWMVSLRERLRSKFLYFVNWIGQHWLQVGNGEKAIECYQRGLDTDDLAEEFYQGLMTCYQRLNRETEAREVYHRCLKILSSAPWNWTIGKNGGYL